MNVFKPILRQITRPIPHARGSAVECDPVELQFDGHPHGRLKIPLVDVLSDVDLRHLNDLLPWHAYVVDSRGRRFGNWTSPTKRSEPQEVPDRRIVELDKRIPLRECHVLEVGCFEGIHTVALAERARTVLAVDGRIENVVKTIVRCAMFAQSPRVLCWNIEEPPPAGVDLSCDVLHHVGVLYHLTDPVAHLRQISRHVRRVVMLDTHIAPDEAQLRPYSDADPNIKYMCFGESGRESPFAGLSDHAKWLRLDDILHLLDEQGFATIDVAEHRAERNGPRVLIFASR